ncbi:HipA domain-containing protein [Streptosporangium sp. NPDC004379]|uniref:HipA domain-containing protein n=1 Tax=Streptosporangium sp. NPDC004379 TaxID=3366189 RepID=UPI0036D19E06
MPAYQVEQENAEVLQDIFDRMNNYGKRLSKAEIFSALFAGDESEQDRTLTIDVIAAHVDEQFGFGRIDSDTVLRAILARRGPNPEREIRTEFDDENRREVIEFPGEDRDTAFQAGEEAPGRAVRFLQKDAGVPHFSLLAYRYLLIVLTRVFAHFPDPDPVNRKLLRRWYWRAALFGPEIFKGSSTGASRALCAKVQPNDLTGSVQNLLGALNRPEPQLPELRRFRTNEAAAKITLCSWWSLEPRDPSTGKPSEQIELAECLTGRPTAADAVRYLVPTRQMDEKYRLWAANRVLLPAMEQEAGKDIGAAIVNPPLTMDEKEWLEVLDSHLITPAMAALLRDGHLKNWSLIYRDPRTPALSPAYDLVCTRAYMGKGETLGMKFAGSRRFDAVTIRTFERLERRLHAAGAGLGDIVTDLVGRVRSAWPACADLLSTAPEVRESVAASIERRSRTLLSRPGSG